MIIWWCCVCCETARFLSYAPTHTDTHNLLSLEILHFRFKCLFLCFDYKQHFPSRTHTHLLFIDIYIQTRARTHYFSTINSFIRVESIYLFYHLSLVSISLYLFSLWLFNFPCVYEFLFCVDINLISFSFLFFLILYVNYSIYNVLLVSIKIFNVNCIVYCHTLFFLFFCCCCTKHSLKSNNFC